MRTHDFTELTAAELERAKRDLQANLGLITEHSAAQVPINAQIQAIDAELSRRALAALGGEYEEHWKVWKPGRYVADHHRLDVSLKSESVAGLAEKLREFTELVKDLPGMTGP